MRAAPGQWPGPAPGINSPPDCLCPGSAYRIALVPRWRLHFTRFHGVPAPNAGLRAAFVPDPPESSGVHGAPTRMGLVRLLKRVFHIDLQK